MQKAWHSLATICDQVYQLLAHGRWFSPATPASFTTKTGRHDLSEILLKVALKHQKSNQIRKRATLKIFYTVYSTVCLSYYNLTAAIERVSSRRHMGTL